MMRKLLVFVLCLGMVGVVGLSLDRADYRVFWVRADGTVLGGFTPLGRLDTLAGANIGGALTVSGDATFDSDVTITGTLTTDGGINGTLGVSGATTLEDTLLVHGIITSGDDTADSIGGLVIKDDSGVTHASIAGDTGNAMFAGAVTIGDNTANSHGYLQMNNDTGLGKVSLWGETGTVDAWSTVNVGSDLHGGAHGQLNVKNNSDATTFSVDGETGNVSAMGNITHTGATNATGMMVSQYTLTYADTSVQTASVLPAGASVLWVDVATTTEFTGGSGTTINIGWEGTTAGYASDLDIRAAGIATGNAYADLGSIGEEERAVLVDLTTDDAAGESIVRIYWTLGTPGEPGAGE